MKSIKLASGATQKKRMNKDLNKSVMIVLMITGLMMIAVPITVVYVKKIKERKFAQVKRIRDGIIYLITQFLNCFIEFKSHFLK